jgi:hypothetical protein
MNGQISGAGQSADGDCLFFFLFCCLLVYDRVMFLDVTFDPAPDPASRQ